MSTIDKDNDKLLVQRGTDSFTTKAGSLMSNIDFDTDWMLVQRGIESYKVLAKDVIETAFDPLTVSVTLAPTSGYTDEIVVASPVTSGGKEPDGGYQFTYQWYLADDAGGGGASAISGATSQSYTPLSSEIGKYLGCWAATEDFFGNSALGKAYIGPIEEKNSAPVIDSVTLTETGDGSARFTSQTFAYDAVMSDDGEPAPQYALKAKLSGSTFDFDTKSDTITDVDNIVVPGGWNALTVDNNSWTSVTYGNDRFVAVSAHGGTNRVMYSPDGLTWTPVSAIENNRWYSVTYGNGKFVAVATDGTNRVMHSPDGINWTAASAPEANQWRSVIYANNKFVAVASTVGPNQVMHSPDGLTWTGAAATEANSWRSVTYGNGRFVAVSYDGTNRVMYSDNDGLTWTAASAAGANIWQSVTYGNGKFVAVAADVPSQVMYSPDGNIWTYASAAEYSNWTSVTYGNGKFVAVGGSGTNSVTMHSIDGISWTAATATSQNSWESVTYGNGKFVAVSYNGTDRVMWSTTGTDNYEAIELTCASDAGLADIDAAGGEVYMTDGSIELDGSFAKSSYTPTTSNIATGGVVDIAGGWTSATPSTSSSWVSVAYANDGGFVAVGQSGTYPVMYSDDGITWTSSNSPNIAHSFNGVGGSTGSGYIAVGNNGMIRMSLDGNSWTSPSSVPNSYTHYAVTFGGGYWVAVGADRSIIYSNSNGSLWNSEQAPEDQNWGGIAFGNNTFVATGNASKNKIMWAASNNMSSWTMATTSAVNSIWKDVAFGNGKFVVVPASGTELAYSSDDGRTWTSVNTPGLVSDWQSVTYGDGKFVMVSHTKQAWSVDGINWTLVDSPAGSWRSVAYGADKFVAVATVGSSEVMWSSNGMAEKSQTNLTCASDAGLADIDAAGGEVYMTDGSVELDGSYAKSSYTPVTSNIAAGGVVDKQICFSTTLYSGDNIGQDVKTGINNTGKALVWTKSRNNGGATPHYHHLFDTERGVHNYLSSNEPTAELENINTLTSFLDDGFRVGDSTKVNWTDSDYVAWNFRAAPGFLDVVTYAGDASQPQNIPHNLGTVPGLMIVKSYDSNATDWMVYHKEIGATKYLRLNDNLAESTGSNLWNDTEPTAEVFTVGSYSAATNNSGYNYVAYLFADNPAGGIKCGSYTGNGGTNTIDDVGFKPGWLLIKSTSPLPTNTTQGNWSIFDSKRGLTGPVDGLDIVGLLANDDGIGFNRRVDVDDNGFIIGQTYGEGAGDVNESQINYIYVAIAEDAMAGEFPPTGIVTEADPDGPTMTLSNTTGDWTAEVGSKVAGPEKSGVGTFVSTNDTDTMTIKDSNDEWCTTGRNGEQFYVLSTTARMSQAEVDVQQLKFDTYNHRVATYQVSAAARQVLIDDMVAKGYTESEVTSMID